MYVSFHLNKQNTKCVSISNKKGTTNRTCSQPSLKYSGWTGTLCDCSLCPCEGVAEFPSLRGNQPPDSPVFLPRLSFSGPKLSSKLLGVCAWELRRVQKIPPHPTVHLVYPFCLEPATACCTFWLFSVSRKLNSRGPASYRLCAGCPVIFCHSIATFQFLNLPL